MSKIIDLTGQRFGSWVVLEKDTNNKTSGGNYNTKWICKCDCGKIKSVSGLSLRRGTSTNCGCLRFKDYSQLKFGMLKVIERGEIPNTWICECDCGNTVIRTSQQIRDHPYSCGCYRSKLSKERLKQYNKYDLSRDICVGYTNKNEAFLFDIEDYDLIKDYCWYIDAKGYVSTKYGEGHIKLHQLIMRDVSLPNGYVIDHIDRNKLNNSKSNLRILSFRENVINKDAPKNNTSGIIGVHWSNNNKRWIAQITVNSKKIYLGSFIDKHDAIVARLKAENKYFGKEIAPQRNLFNKYDII